MKYGGNRGLGSYGQADPRVPTPMSPMGGAGPGGMPGGGVPPGMPQGMSPGMPSGAGILNGVGPMPGVGMPPQGMPIQGQGGSIRNTLGSGLKSRGVFQKDGRINNSRGGLFSGGGGKMGSGPFSFLGSGGGPGVPQPRQFILESAQAGMASNGIATISLDNVFTCIANLPAPNTLIGQGFGTYAVYLVDNKGQTGFLAGILRSVGNGVYQTQFRSQVPLTHYSRVLITVENPQNLGHVPQGPIVLQVKQPSGPSRFLTPVKNAGGSVWKKISGLIQRKAGGSAEPTIPIEPSNGGIPTDSVLEAPVTPVAPELPLGTPPIDPFK